MWADNWTRRVWPFQRNADGRWVQGPEPLFGPPPATGAPSYQDHTYGHQFITEESGERWVFYERVVETHGTRPAQTALYARRMVSTRRAADEEHFILGPGTPPKPTARRAQGDALVEGGRPVHVVVGGESFYLLGFSAGDFRSGTYGLHFAVSRHLLGPYHPYLTADGRDFLDLGHAIRTRYGLSWGPGRPALFADPTGGYWLLFHATQPRVLQDFRNLYLAPVDLRMEADGWPSMTVLDNNPGGAPPMMTSPPFVSQAAMVDAAPTDTAPGPTLEALSRRCDETF
jgi:hypothetical protein